MTGQAAKPRHSKASKQAQDPTTDRSQRRGATACHGMSLISVWLSVAASRHITFGDRRWSRQALQDKILTSNLADSHSQNAPQEF